MSTYLTAETALLAVCRAYEAGAVFGEANSSIDDWRVLDSPTSDEAIVIEMGGPSTEGDTLETRGSMGLLQERHQFAVSVVRKVGTGEQGVTAIIRALKERTESLKAYLRRHDRLGYAPGINKAWPIRTGVVQGAGTRRDGIASHVMQVITVEVFAETEYPESEGGA